MRRAIRFGIVAFAALWWSGGCKGGQPTTPSDPRQPSTPISDVSQLPVASSPPGETFTVSGDVTDEQGAPVASAPVIMAHWLGGRARRPSALTDAAGHYVIEFAANPWTNATGRYAARAEIIIEDYDWYWRNVMAAGSQLVENFRIHRVKRIAAGESVVVPVSVENGDCTGWLFNPCGRARVTVPVNGNLTVQAISPDESTAAPNIEVCCVNGNEVQGNPVTLRVNALTEMWVEVGQSRAVANPSPIVTLTTSLQPF